jgi:copper chaperone CopZ
MGKSNIGIRGDRRNASIRAADRFVRSSEETMEQVFSITGMHCAGCVKRVSNALASIADQVSVTLEPPQAVLLAAAPLSAEEVDRALAQAGEFHVAAA